MAEKSLQIFEIAADLAISGCKCIPQRMQIARTKTSQFKHRQKVYFATNCTPELVLAQSPRITKNEKSLSTGQQFAAFQSGLR